MEVNNQKKCFVITPIGNEGTDIRRHIDGILDAAIKPVIEDELGYIVEVSHRIDMPGNIPKQVITSVFDSDLVIANLTGNNPNVMYELALRHCFGSVVIIIAEKGTSIPADIVGERTIFYINDAKGVIDLKDNLRKMVDEINKVGEIKQHGPVYDALRDKLITDNIITEITDNESANAFVMLLDRIDDLEKSISVRSTSQNTSFIKKHKPGNSIVVVADGIDSDRMSKIMNDSISPVIRKYGLPFGYSVNDKGVLKISFDALRLKDFDYIRFNIKNIFSMEGIDDVYINIEMD